MTLLGLMHTLMRGREQYNHFLLQVIVVLDNRYHNTHEKGIELTVPKSYSPIYSEFCNSELQRNASISHKLLKRCSIKDVKRGKN